jgi:hypothetical protein
VNDAVHPRTRSENETDEKGPADYRRKRSPTSGFSSNVTAATPSAQSFYTQPPPDDAYDPGHRNVALSRDRPGMLIPRLYAADPDARTGGGPVPIRSAKLFSYDYRVGITPRTYW